MILSMNYAWLFSGKEETQNLLGLSCNPWAKLILATQPTLWVCYLSLTFYRILLLVTISIEFSVYLKSIILQSRFLLLLLFPVIFVACTDDVQIQKSALRYFNEGNSALKHRDYQVAIWNYQKAISLDSESPNFHYNLGLTYYEIGNYSESIDSFKRVELLVPSQSDTYYNLALAYYKMSNSRLADIYYNRYQDMLSLKKAQERLVEVRKEQEREARIAESDSKQKVIKRSSTGSKNKSSSKNNTRQGKSEVPNWEWA